MQRYLARQPIFDQGRVIFGYEILFRSGPENYFSHPQPDVASATAGDNVILFGLERLARGKRLFINCTREFILREFPAVLPKDRVVLEVLESIAVDEPLIAACRELRQAGYQLALDDYCDSCEWRPLLPLADFVKVDVLATSDEEQVRLARAFARTHIQLVAEKVESYEVFEKARERGYRYFQGYFFSRPESVTHHDVPPNKINYLLVLQVANRLPIDLDDIAERIKTEASLSYRLLRYLNSAAFPLVKNVSSIPPLCACSASAGRSDGSRWWPSRPWLKTSPKSWCFSRLYGRGFASWSRRRSACGIPPTICSCSGCFRPWMPSLICRCRMC